MADVALARRALRCLDLTDLSENTSEQAVDELCAKALTLHGPVAAVCVWPGLAFRARTNLAGTPVRVATVVNFPGGWEDDDEIARQVLRALEDGADEIDLVLPYRALARGEGAIASDIVAGVRHIANGRLLKVILETGELGDPELIAEASRIAVAAGADFIKTSTGKTSISATPRAAEIMLNAIKASGRPVGLKPSGGIRTLADAALYLNLADRIMGEGWATPETFRIGASSLYDALLAAIEGRADAPDARTY